jgi:hypothetical protein
MSQRARLVAIVAVAVLPLVALSALDIVTELRESEQRVAEERVQAARLLAFAVEAFIDGNLSTLAALTLHPAVAAGRRSPQLDRVLAQVADDNPQWAGLAVVGPDGASVASALATASPSVGDRPYFREAMATGRPVVGDAVIGRRSGKVSVVLAVPYVADDGRRLVLAAPLPTDRFRNLIVSKLAPAPAQFTVIDRVGHVFIGGHGGEHELVSARGPEVSAVLAGETGRLRVRGADGELLAAYAPVGEYGFGAMIREPASSAFASARREALQRSAVLAAIVFTIGMLAWALGSRVGKLYQRALDARGEAERLAGELRHALTTRDDFLASAAHDLRNPL